METLQILGWIYLGVCLGSLMGVLGLGLFQAGRVTALESDGMVAEGVKLAKIANNIVIKLPLTQEGLKACTKLTKKKIKTNVTLCFSPSQAL